EEERVLAQALPKGRARRGRPIEQTPHAAPVATATPVEPALKETPAFTPMPAPQTRAEGGSIEALLARQNIILDTLMERQIALLRNIERALIALERRFGSATQGITNLPRSAVFVDVPNVVYAAERIGCTIDFTKLLNYLTRGRELVRASAYAP